MAHIWNDKDQRAERLNEQSGSLDNRILGLRQKIKRDERLMDAYSHPGWDAIAEGVLESELNDIARKAIKVDSTDMPNRYRAEGAYDKVNNLFRRKDVLQRDIDEDRGQLLKLMEEQSAVLNKLRKTQE